MTHYETTNDDRKVVRLYAKRKHNEMINLIYILILYFPSYTYMGSFVTYLLSKNSVTFKDLDIALERLNTSRCRNIYSL